MVGAQMGVPQRRGVRLVAGELLDLEQRHPRGDQARAERVTQIVIAKVGAQIRFLDGFLVKPYGRRCGRGPRLPVEILER
jgi:hypothetical protein